METTSSADNNGTEFLSVKNSPRSARDAATQTPQMIRHNTPSIKEPSPAPSKGLSSSEESLLYHDSIAYPSPVNNVSTAIPTVIVEHSKDTIPLTKETVDANSAEHLPGITNLAFESKGEVMRYSPTSGFTQKFDSYHHSGSVESNKHLLVTSDAADRFGPSTISANRRLYYSLPRVSTKKQEKDLIVRSQPQTPQMNRTKDTGVDTNSAFWIIPREDSINSLNTIPAAGAKYMTPDNVNGLYTISGSPAVMANGYPEPVIGLYEMHLLPPVTTPAQSTPTSVRKFEFTKMPASVDRNRRRLQFCTDGLSVLFLLPGLLIAGLTPALVAPMFFVAPSLFPMFITIFLASGTLSAVLLAISGIIGNVVWYYDETTKKLRPRMHCGKGPTFHFWGNGFYDLLTKKPKEKDVDV